MELGTNVSEYQSGISIHSAINLVGDQALQLPLGCARWAEQLRCDIVLIVVPLKKGALRGATYRVYDICGLLDVHRDVIAITCWLASVWEVIDQLWLCHAVECWTLACSRACLIPGPAKRELLTGGRKSEFTATWRDAVDCTGLYVCREPVNDGGWVNRVLCVESALVESRQFTVSALKEMEPS